MAQRNDRALKVIFMVDGTAVPNLTKLNGIKLENGTIDVPGYDRIVKIQNGIKVIPDLEAEFKDPVGGNANDLFNDWYEQKEVHDVMIRYVDATGQEFDRISCPACECASYERPEYDAANPGFAKIMTKLLPYGAQRIKA